MLDPHTNAERRVVDLLCTWDRPTLEQLADMLRARDPIGTDACDAAFIGAPSDEGESACARTDRVVADLPVPVPVIRRGADAAISFDPVHDTIPGLDNYDWVRRLREPSYRVARSSRATSSRRF